MRRSPRDRSAIADSRGWRRISVCRAIWTRIHAFYRETCRIWYRALNRRSQRRFSMGAIRPAAQTLSPTYCLSAVLDWWSLANSGKPREEPSVGKPPARICEGYAEWLNYSTTAISHQAIEKQPNRLPERLRPGQPATGSACRGGFATETSSACVGSRAHAQSIRAAGSPHAYSTATR